MEWGREYVAITRGRSERFENLSINVSMVVLGFVIYTTIGTKTKILEERSC